MTGTRFAKALKVATRKEFTHVSISLDEDLNELYSFGRRSMVMPIIAGFIHEDIKQGVYEKYDSYCEILELNISRKQYQNVEKEIKKYIRAYSSYRYNFLGLPLMWLDIPYERENHLVCSQFVASVLTLSEIHTFNKSWTLIRPMDFYDIPGVRSIYRGQLREYNISKQVNCC